VDAGDAAVRVLGTRFSVRRGVEQVNVAVLEGRVEVTPVAQPSRVLTAGQRITTGAEVLEAQLESFSPGAAPDAWHAGRLSFDGVPLAEVIADVNRYYPAGITLAASSLANLRVTTSFEAGQIDLMIDSLTVALPLTAERRPDGHVVLAPK